MENFEIPKLSLAEADSRIRGIWEMNTQTARMDSEHNGFQAILHKLHAREYSPEEAVQAANILAGGRQEGMEG